MKQKAQIINFPKAKTTRVLNYQKSESKHILGALSLVSLVLVAVFANEQMTKSQRPIYVVSDNYQNQSINELNRAIASSQPLNPLRDLEWEAQLAKKLGQKSVIDRSPASFGRNVSSLDQIRFGDLAGKYRLSANADEKLFEIDYVASNDVEDRPQFMDRESFLRKYRTAIAIPYSRFELEGVSGNAEIYRLQDSNHQVVGRAQFTLDDQGRFINFKVLTQ